MSRQNNVQECKIIQKLTNNNKKDFLPFDHREFSTESKKISSIKNKKLNSGELVTILACS